MHWLLFHSIGCKGEISNGGRAHCPSGLVPIPSSKPTFCIQPFEAKIVKNGTAISEKGVLPTVNASLYDAFEACKNTVLNNKPLRLVSHQEWLRAASGEAGVPFPWGDKDDSRCVLDTPTNPHRWTSVQPTGSMKECVSVHGVYDQIGNAWEWVDLKQTANKRDWLQQLEQNYTVQIQDDGISVDDRVLPRLRLQTICVEMEGLSVVEGQLHVRLTNPISPDCESGGLGYLWANLGQQNHRSQSLPEPGSLLPVRLEGSRVVWDSDRDGEPVGAKVGGSFYSGAQMTLQDLWIGHIPTFDGSIGFRCVSDPI